MKQRKVRVTKKAIKKIQEQNKISSATRKRTIIPGPWTNKTTKLKVDAFLVEHKSICHNIGSYNGIYSNNQDINERGWYPLFINISFPDIKNIAAKHDVDEIMTACEISLNQKDKTGKKRYGDLVILELASNNSQKEDEPTRFLSCKAKTNRKNITGFAAVRNGEFGIISPAENNE